MLFFALIFIESCYMIISYSSFSVGIYTRFVAIKVCLHFHNYNVLVFDTFSVKSKNILAVFFALQRSIISTGLEHVVDTTLYLWKGQVDMKSNII